MSSISTVSSHSLGTPVTYLNSVPLPRISGYVCFLNMWNPKATTFVTKKRVSDSTVKGEVRNFPLGVSSAVGNECIALNAEINSQLTCSSKNHLSGTTCTAKCNDGYFYPNKAEEKVTCVKMKGIFRWTHQSRSNPYAKLSACFKVDKPKIFKTSFQLYFNRSVCKTLTDKAELLKGTYIAIDRLNKTCLHLRNNIRDGKNERCAVMDSYCIKGETNSTIHLFLEQMTSDTEELKQLLNYIKKAVYSNALSITTKINGTETHVSPISYKEYEMETKCKMSMYDNRTSKCLSCPAGYRKISQSCVKCNFGSYSDEANTTCNHCPKGNFFWDFIILLYPLPYIYQKPKSLIVWVGDT